MFADFVSNANKDDQLVNAIKSLNGRPVRVATLCS